MKQLNHEKGWIMYTWFFIQATYLPQNWCFIAADTLPIKKRFFLFITLYSCRTEMQCVNSHQSESRNALRNYTLRLGKTMKSL
jgi:hypothetical protein